MQTNTIFNQTPKYIHDAHSQFGYGATNTASFPVNSWYWQVLFHAPWNAGGNAVIGVQYKVRIRYYVELYIQDISLPDN